MKPTYSFMWAPDIIYTCAWGVEMIFEIISQVTLVYYKYQTLHQVVVTFSSKWTGKQIWFIFSEWWLLTVHKQQLHNSLYNDKRAAWEPVTWFMFGIFRQTCRQMDAPLVVYYSVRETPAPPLYEPCCQPNLTLSHDRGQGEVSKCRLWVWLIWLRKKRQRPAACELGTETDRASRQTLPIEHTGT